MAVLELDFAAAQVGVPLEPDIDDFATRNDVTAVLRDVGSARAVDEDGPLGVAAIGRSRTRVDVSPASEGDLPDHASWHLALGTIEDARWPQVTVDLDATPSLAATVSAVDAGDLIRISNLPADLVPGLAELVILGYIETVESHRRLVVFNTLPATIYQQTGVYGTDPDVVSRYDSAHSTLAAGVSAAATSLPVVTAIGHAPWITTAAFGAQFPFDVGCAGVRLPVSAISSAVRDTFTRTEASGWGTPDTGPSWTVIEGPASDVIVSAGAGRLSLSAAGTGRQVALPVAFADVDITVGSVTWPAIPTGTGNPQQELWARFVDSSNFVEAALFRITSNQTTFRLRQVLAGVETAGSFITIAGSTATSTISVRLQAIGSTLQMKAWLAADPQPAAWSATLTATMLAAGQIRLRTGAPAGSTNVFPLVATYDNLEVANPQAFTVGRSADGYDKALTSGAQVRLWTPARFAL